MYKKIVGIYQIQSKINPNRVYIGSGLNIHQRWNQHLQDLRKNIHHSGKLQNHYNKYGESDLQFSILTCCDREDLLQNEQFFIDSLKPWFNIQKIAGSPLGVKRSKEFCDKVSKREMGNTYVKGKHWNASEEAKANISKGLLLFYQTEEGKLSAKKRGEKMRGHKKPEGMGAKLSKSISGEKNCKFGKKLPKTTTDKMSKSRIGNKNRLGYKESEEVKAKKRERAKRENLSEETLEKMREAQIGKKHSEETKRKISEGNKGKTVSEETREKLRKIALVRNANKKKDGQG